MLGTRYSHLIERHSEELAESLVQKLHASERSVAYRKIPAEDLKRALSDVYLHLGEWLENKTEAEVEQRYSALGRRRAEQGIPVAQVIWALIISKEHLWTFLQREALADTAVQLVTELAFVLRLEAFFDRAIYFAVAGYSKAVTQEQAA